MYLLKNGIVIDGSGRPGFRADVLTDGERITEVSEVPVTAGSGCETIDCSGMYVAPGFIDIHSHNDWFIGSENADYFIDPFLRQGITSFVGGNCGFGIAGFKPGSEHLGLLENNLFKEGVASGISWDSYSSYFDFLQQKGIPANIAVLAGSGTVRTSISGYAPGRMTPEVFSEYCGLVEESLDQGVKGLSFGMGYAPDIFSGFDEQKKAAGIVRDKDGFVSMHVKAFSKVSGAYPFNPLAKAHNLRAIEEFLRLGRETGVRLQLSHLIFVGEKTWGTVGKALELIDSARRDGVDVEFDTYFHQCGATVITGILPDWFMAGVPEFYSDKRILSKLRRLLLLSFGMLGFGWSDMRLAAANINELEGFDGMYLSEIAEKRGMDCFDNYIDIAARSGSTARLMIDKYSSPRIISELMAHPSSHFMTDAWMEPSGNQNPAVYNCFPGFIRKAAVEQAVSMEECIRKMTGANADRAGIKDRGYVRKGYYADLAVFRPEDIPDPDSGEARQNTGIRRVFVNGRLKVDDGRVNHGFRNGAVI